MKNAIYSTHIISLFAIVTVGNAILSLRFSDINIFTFFLCSCAFSVLLYFGSFKLIQSCQNHKYILAGMCVLICCLAVVNIAITIYDFYSFLSSVQMPQCNHMLLLIVVLCTTGIFAAFRISAVYKYCLLTGVLIATIIILCFVAGIKNYDISSVGQLVAEDVFSLKIFLKYFSSFFVFPLLFYWQQQNVSFKIVFLGTLSGFVALIFISCQTIFTLGNSSHNFDYLRAVSTISTSGLFSRLDGLTFFVCFATCIIKITLLIKAILSSANRIIRKTPDHI